MSCLTNSVSFRLKSLIYWKNFYYVNNNYIYLIYNDFKFLAFLESFFTTKISSKFSVYSFFFKAGLFFSFIKINKIYKKITILIYFNHIIFSSNFLRKKESIQTKIFTNMKMDHRSWAVTWLNTLIYLFSKIFFLKKINKIVCKNFYYFKNFIICNNWIYTANINSLLKINNKFYSTILSYYYDLHQISFKKKPITANKGFTGHKPLLTYFQNKFNLTRELFSKITFFYNIFFIFLPLFAFLKYVLIKFYQLYFFNFQKKFVNLLDIKIFFIIRKRLDISANLLMYFVMGKLIRYYKLPYILHLINQICELYIRLKILRGYKILCAGRFSRKDRASYVWRSFSIPLNTKFSAIDFCWKNIILKYSICIIKIWVCK